MDDFLNSLPDNNSDFLDSLPESPQEQPTEQPGLLGRIKNDVANFFSNAAGEVKDWGGKVADDFNAIIPVQIQNRSNEEIQEDTNQQNQQLGQLYSDAVANPAGKVAITPYVPAPVRAAAGALFLPELASSAYNNYQQNSQDDQDEGGTGSGMGVVGKTAYDTVVAPVVEPVKEAFSNPGGFEQSIVNDPANLWSKVFLPGAVAKGAYDGGKKAVEGVKNQYGQAMDSLDQIDGSIPKAPDAFFDSLPKAEVTDARTEVQQPQETYQNIYEPTEQGAVPLGANAYDYAVNKSGTPYELGGDGSSSTDCGKLVQDSFNAAGVDFNSRYVPSMIDEADEKGAWHPAGDGYVPQKGDAAVVLGDNHVVLSDGEGGYVGANSSTGVIEKPSIDDDFGKVTGYISVGDLTGNAKSERIPLTRQEVQGQPESSYTTPQTTDDPLNRSLPADEGDIDISGKPLNQTNDLDAMTKEQQMQSDAQRVINEKPIDSGKVSDVNWDDNKNIGNNVLDQSAKTSKIPDIQVSPDEMYKSIVDKASQGMDNKIAMDRQPEYSRMPQTAAPVLNDIVDTVSKRIEQQRSLQSDEMRDSINEEMLNKAHQASENGDYATAAEYARQAGANDWAKSFQLVADTDGGSKPIAPRLDNKTTSEYTGDTITKRQIMKRAADLFVPIRTGRIGKADVMGFADHNSGVIRTRDYGDLSTMAHEIGHITDAALGLRGEAGAFDREFSRVVDNRFGKDAYKPEQKRAEGIAEFMKDYLTNENKAKAEMPAYYSQFKAALEKNPDIKGRVNEIKSMVDTWQRQSPEARGRAAVSYADEMKPTIKERVQRGKLKFVEDWVDDKIGLKRVTESYERATGERLATKDDPYKMARLAQNSSVARAQMLVEGEKPELVKAALNKIYGNILDKVVTIKGVLKELDSSPKLKGEKDYLKAGNFKNWHEALDSLLVARRQAELQKIYPSYKGPMSQVDAQAIIKNAPKALTDAAQKIYTYNDNILRILKENGMIKSEVYKALTDKYRNYVSMARDSADESGLEKGFGMGGKGFGNVRAALKSISEEGSTRQVVSPLESIVKNTYAMLNLVERNRVGQTFVKMAEGDRVGKLIEEVSGTANTKDSTFSVWVNGEKKVYQTEPEIYRAIMSVNQDTANIITKLLSPPAQLLRAGATLMPDFAIKNIMRDSFGAAVFSRYGFRPVIDHIAGIFHMAKQDQLFHEYKASGALMSTMVGLDRDYIQGSLKGLYKKDIAHYWNHYNPVQLLRGFSEMLETATRLGEYGRAVSKGVSVEDAALSARDISLDFSKHGVYGKTANKVVAFFNAGVQEPARIIQAFQENPAGTSAKIAKYITLPSVALWTYIYSDEERRKEYQEMLPYEKNLFWNIPVSKNIISTGWMRIPKPFGLGVVFGSLPERALDQAAPYILSRLYPEHALEYMAKKDPDGMKEWANSAKDAFLPNFIPTAVGPIIEWATGYSFFQGRDIVPQKEQKLPDEMQYGPNTSELAKDIGRIFGVSPRKIDNTISGYGAGMANQTLNAVDAINGKRDYQNPFSKAFTVDPLKSPQSVQDFYDKLNDVEKTYNGAKLNKEKLSSDDLHNYNLLNYANKNMQYLNKMERSAIQKGDTDRIEEIKKKQLNVAQKAMEKVRE
jgi:hypothetical protein